MVICLYGRVGDKTPTEQVDSERGEGMNKIRGELVKTMEHQAVLAGNDGEYERSHTENIISLASTRMINKYARD